MVSKKIKPKTCIVCDSEIRIKWGNLGSKRGYFDSEDGTFIRYHGTRWFCNSCFDKIYDYWKNKYERRRLHKDIRKRK